MSLAMSNFNPVIIFDCVSHFITIIRSLADFTIPLLSSRFYKRVVIVPHNSQIITTGQTVSINISHDSCFGRLNRDNGH